VVAIIQSQMWNELQFFKMGDLVSQRPITMITRTTCGALIVRRHAILVNSVAAPQELGSLNQEEVEGVLAHWHIQACFLPLLD
jgi:hypothetical protein